MNKLPQIVKARLGSRQPGADVHPDANLLAAFSEAMLASVDRETVLQHLSACPDCRDVLALMIPEVEASQPAQTVWVPSRWRFMRWVAVTACVAVIGAAGLWQYQRRGQSQMAQLERAIPTPSQPPAAVPVSSEEVAVVNAETAPKTEKFEARAESKKAMPAPQENLARKPMPAVVIPAPLAKQTDSIASLQDNAQPGAPSAENQPARVSGAFVRAKPATGVAGGIETVEVTGRNEVLTAPAAAVGGPLVAAKAMAPESAAGAPSAPPAWQISSSGSLQRSQDKGATWQDVAILPDTTPGPNLTARVASATADFHARAASTVPVQQPSSKLEFRALFTSGPEIWAGGAGGALFHSVDSGTRWIRVMPASQLRVLTGDIVKISFDDSLHGSVTTSTHEVWATSDDGLSWRQQ